MIYKLRVNGTAIECATCGMVVARLVWTWPEVVAALERHRHGKEVAA